MPSSRLCAASARALRRAPARRRRRERAPRRAGDGMRRRRRFSHGKRGLWARGCRGRRGAVFVAPTRSPVPGGGDSYGRAAAAAGEADPAEAARGRRGSSCALLVWFIFSELPWPLKLLIIGVMVAVYVVNRARDAAGCRSGAAAPVAPGALAGTRLIPARPARHASPHDAASRTSAASTRSSPSSSSRTSSTRSTPTSSYAAAGRARPALGVPRARRARAPARRAGRRGAHRHRRRPALHRACAAWTAQAGQVEVDVEIESNVASVAAPGQPERTSYLHRALDPRASEGRAVPPSGARTHPRLPRLRRSARRRRGGHLHPLQARGRGMATSTGWCRAADVVESEERGPMLTTEVAERGNDLPTVVDPEVQAPLRRAIAQRDPYFQWPAFEARVGLVFREFQAAWTKRDLLKMRPYFTDALFDTQRYWVEAYRAQGLRNVTDARAHPGPRARARRERQVVRRHHRAPLGHRPRLRRARRRRQSRARQHRAASALTPSTGPSSAAPPAPAHAHRAGVPELRRAARRWAWPATAGTAGRR